MQHFQEIKSKITTDYSFCDVYLRLMEHTESPLLYHRWCFLSAIGALLERNVWLPFGNDNVYANQFVLLTGQPGARKNSAIKPIIDLMNDSGYEFITGSKSGPEKFFADWMYGFDKINRGEDMGKKKNGKINMDVSVHGFDGSSFSEYSKKVQPVYVISEEFQAFLGRAKAELVPIITDLWDNKPKYADRNKQAEDIFIPNPTISILGGTTPSTFAKMFSDADAIMGQGILSRLILVYGEQRQRLTIPPPYDTNLRSEIINIFKYVRNDLRGPIRVGRKEFDLLDGIYQSWKSIPDSRLNSYCARRFTHLLKLCLIIAALEMRDSLILHTEDIIFANSILTFTESMMPKALGEFGKAKNSAVHQAVLETIQAATHTGGLTGQQILAATSQDIENIHTLAAIINKLEVSKKIKSYKSNGENYFIATNPMTSQLESPYVDLSLLWEHRLKDAYPKVSMDFKDDDNGLAGVF